MLTELNYLSSFAILWSFYGRVQTDDDASGEVKTWDHRQFNHEAVPYADWLHLLPACELVLRSIRDIVASGPIKVKCIPSHGTVFRWTYQFTRSQVGQIA